MRKSLCKAIIWHYLFVLLVVVRLELIYELTRDVIKDPCNQYLTYTCNLFDKIEEVATNWKSQCRAGIDLWVKIKYMSYNDPLVLVGILQQNI